MTREETLIRQIRDLRGTRTAGGRKDAAREETKDRLTVALDPEVARALRAEAAARKATVSGVAEEALRAFLRDALREASERLSGPDGRDGAEESEVVAGMVLELLRYQFPSTGDISDGELRRRAVAARGGRARDA